VVPIVIVPDVFTMNPYPACPPFCTNTKSPYATSPAGELSASVARVKTQFVPPGFGEPVAVTV